MSNADQLELWAIYTEADQSNQGFITDYARTKHMEFFAEAVEACIHQDAQGRFSKKRQGLRDTNPRFYNLVPKLLEPGVTGPAPKPLSAAWTVARGKANDATAPEPFLP